MKTTLPTHLHLRASMTLLEVMIAMTILAIALVGIGMAVYQIDRANMFTQDRATAHLAAEQVMETVTHMGSVAGTTSYNGSTFTVGSMLTPKSAATGTVSTVDMSSTWPDVGATGAVVRVTVSVTSGGVVYAQLENVVSNEN